jgi:predicted PurR-regulated permease PerM
VIQHDTSTREDPAVGGSSKAVQITVSVRTLGFIAIVTALAVALFAIRSSLILVFTGIFLAFVFELPVRALMRRFGLGRGIAGAIVVLGSSVAVAILGLLFLVPIVGSLIDFLKALPTLVEDLRDSGELSWLGDSGAAENVQTGSEKLASTIPNAIDAFLGVAGNAFSAGIAAFTIIFLALFLIVDLPRLQGAVASVLFPGDSDRVLALWERITHTVSRWAIGAGLIAIIAGTVQGGTAWLVGSSYALALGVIAGLLDLIPTIGATIAGFILVPTVLAEEGLTAALIMLAVILVYQQVENNLITPTVQGKAVEISGFFVMLGVTIFGALLGVLGALVAVPVTASLQIIAKEITADRRARVAEARAAAAAAEAPGTTEASPAPQPG